MTFDESLFQLSACLSKSAPYLLAMSDRKENPGETARHLLRGTLTASLATSLEGHPYASLVIFAVDQAGHPLLLLSDLAEHTANLRGDPRASLLLDGTQGLSERLTGPRLSLIGEVAKILEEREALVQRFISYHPSAAFYAGFKDFNLYRMSLSRAHLVAGFGAINWIEADELLTDCAGARELKEVEAEIVAHMNEDHLDAIAAMAEAQGKGADGWKMAGLDPLGCDLICDGLLLRLSFQKAVSSAETARVELVRLTKQARRRLAKES